MATNQLRWVGNLNGAKEPLIMLGLFQAGATQAIKRGELLELTADTNTRWTPLDSDYDMSGGDIAIANEEIKSGDRAGYYEIIVPRPGDLFRFDKAAAGADALATPVYFSDSETVTITTGTHIIGMVASQEHYPAKQGHLADDASGDAGETIRSTSHCSILIEASNSYYSRLQTA